MGEPLPTTNLTWPMVEAWMLHDTLWHGNFFLKREPDGSLTRLDPTTVRVTSESITEETE